MSHRDCLRDIVVLRALPGLGDMLCIVPALRALRAGHPDARIALIGLPSARTFVERFPDLIDELIPMPGFPGLPEQPADPVATVGFLREMQERRFDLAVQMHGSGGVTNMLVALLGARRTAGCVRGGEDGALLDVALPYPDDLPEPLRWTALTRHLGLAEVQGGIGFPITEADRVALGGMAPPGRFAVVHPGASVPERRWPAERFAAVADALAARGLVIVLTGTSGEQDLVASVAARMTAPALDLSGKTSLGAMAALLDGAALLVSNDTGVSHLAAAIGTPSVILFTGSDRSRWAPIDTDRHRAVGHGLPDGATTAAPHPGIDEVLAALDLLDLRHRNVA